MGSFCHSKQFCPGVALLTEQPFVFNGLVEQFPQYSLVPAHCINADYLAVPSHGISTVVDIDGGLAHISVGAVSVEDGCAGVKHLPVL